MVHICLISKTKCHLSKDHLCAYALLKYLPKAFKSIKLDFAYLLDDTAPTIGSGGGQNIFSFVDCKFQHDKTIKEPPRPPPCQQRLAKVAAMPPL